MFLSEDIIEPFWGAPSGRLGGRDPLGIQNSSVVVYSSLIPGLTNLTRRVRYNGFYCWLLRTIARHLTEIDPSSVDSKTEQIRYIRRGELLLAYIMVGNPELGDPNGVSGSRYAREHLDDSDDINLVLGADAENGLDKTFWRNSMGIFGQYYLGALLQLGLVCAPGSDRNTYRCTKDGERLADAFEANVAGQSERFWESIYNNGTLQKELLQDFICFSLTTIPDGTELDFYRKLFFDIDSVSANVTYHRAETIRDLLTFIDVNPVSRGDCSDDFLRGKFESILENGFESATDITKSWFLYELNELVHSSYEAFHFGILNSLAKGTSDPVPLSKVIGALLDDVDELSMTIGVYTMNDFDVDVRAHDIYRSMLKDMQSSRTSESIFKSLQLLHFLNKHIEPISEQIGTYAREKHLSRIGMATSLLSKFFDGREDLSIHEFAEEMLYDAINAHMRSSYEKSTVTQGLVHNYMIEEGTIWRLRETYPIRTSPRLDSLLMYMEDIRWIGPDGEGYVIKPAGQLLMSDGR